MTTISLRMPEDVIDDLKEIALMRSYIGQGLHKDLQRLEGSKGRRPDIYQPRAKP